ncbi:MAG: hypothetical protein J6S82_06990 [Bacteroidales bacterium]|nr:hypothetical protein [Bacteroidales bacterium]
MTTMTVQIPNSQVGWFEQMIRSMGWRFRKEETTDKTLDSEVDELLAMFKTDQISQEEIDNECESVREELFNERQTH